ncbi:MAG: DNA topoisomerase, partial [Clostridium sp.]|nr:DNA topoisomerase [Clostridium sp.]
LKVADVNLARKSAVEETLAEEPPAGEKESGENASEPAAPSEKDGPKKAVSQEALLRMLAKLKKGDILTLADLFIKEGETSPPKRYTSGSMILAMENAGQLIEDEELRAQIKGSGIGTSATRAEILKKLFNINYLSLNKKTQVITPALLGEMVYDVVDNSIRQLLNPDLTASWEKGLTYVAEGTITPDEYMQKLERFVAGRTVGVIRMDNQYHMRQFFDRASAYYGPKAAKSKTNTTKQE